MGENEEAFERVREETFRHDVDLAEQKELIDRQMLLRRNIELHQLF